MICNLEHKLLYYSLIQQVEHDNIKAEIKVKMVFNIVVFNY